MASDRKALVELLDRCADAFHEAVYGKQTDECQGSDLCSLCTPCESALLVLRAEVMAARAALAAPPDAQGGAPVAGPRPGLPPLCTVCNCLPEFHPVLYANGTKRCGHYQPPTPAPAAPGTEAAPANTACARCGCLAATHPVRWTMHGVPMECLQFTAGRSPGQGAT